MVGIDRNLWFGPPRSPQLLDRAGHHETIESGVLFVGRGISSKKGNKRVGPIDNFHSSTSTSRLYRSQNFYSMDTVTEKSRLYLSCLLLCALSKL